MLETIIDHSMFKRFVQSLVGAKQKLQTHLLSYCKCFSLLAEAPPRHFQPCSTRPCVLFLLSELPCKIQTRVASQFNVLNHHHDGFSEILLRSLCCWFFSGGPPGLAPAFVLQMLPILPFQSSQRRVAKNFSEALGGLVDFRHELWPRMPSSDYKTSKNKNFKCTYGATTSV